MSQDRRASHPVDIIPESSGYSSQNHFRFVASIGEREVMRYTPAGIPMVAARLLHSSQQVEAGTSRAVEFDVAALAAGEVAGKFSRAALGGTFAFNGFLARKNRNSKSMVFHIADFHDIERQAQFDSTTN